MPDITMTTPPEKTETQQLEMQGITESPKPEKSEIWFKKNKIWRWFADKDKLTDTKTIFDSLRNMGICVAMLIGTESLYKITEPLGVYLQSFIGLWVIGISGFLAIANIVWTVETLKEESSAVANVCLMIFGSLVIFAFALKAFCSMPIF